jgi:hypothetical protein
MRSRPTRLTVCALALIVIGVAATFLVQSEQQISRRRVTLRAFDLQARAAMIALADVRAAQQAYVAAGQGVTFWMPKVESLVDTASRSVDTLRAFAHSAAAGEFLLQAASLITHFGNVDRRARDYLKSGQPLMAGDVVFTEGSETAAQAGRQIEAARLAEYEATDRSEAAKRVQQASALGGAAALSILALGLLASARPLPERAQAPAEETAKAPAAAEGGLRLRDAPARPAEVAGGKAPQSLPLLKEAAALCTELGRVNDRDELQRLLARAADALDASGLILWLARPAGTDLRAVLAHGYPAQALARMPAIPRSANNAVAAAYRSSAFQIVLSRPGVASGAVVAPLLSPEGCVGALTAEINSRGETSDAVQALTAIVAAQLVGVLASSSASNASAAEGRIAI